ncbi:MAG TPA: tetratricopeptide repeat protein [Rhizomicrobium sp.]|nr:tetratricopeptide repeat protein [Rhizomicrobium sp.]
MRRAAYAMVGALGLGMALGPAALAETLPNDAMEAAAALRAGHAAEAEDFATRALQQKGLDGLLHAHLLLNRALAREQLGRRRDALSDFNDAIALGALPPDELARACFDRGVTLDELGRTDEAVAEYSAALKIVPGFAPALNNRANAERRLGRLPEAKSDYEAALAAGDREKEYPYYGLGQIAEIEGDMKTASEDYRMALAANGDYRLAAQRLAALSTQAGKIDLQPPAVQAVVAAPVAAQPAAAPPAVVQPAVATSADAPLELRPSITGHAHAKRVAVLIPSRPETPRPETPRPESGANGLVQLGAFRDEASANAAWKEIAAKSAGALDGLSPDIAAAGIPGKGTFWRLRTSVPDAPAFCAKLTASGLACMRVK